MHERFVLSADPLTAFLASHEPNLSFAWAGALRSFREKLDDVGTAAHQHLIVRTLKQHAQAARSGPPAFCVVASRFPCQSDWHGGCPIGVPAVMVDSEDDVDHLIDVRPGGPRARHCLRLWSTDRCMGGAGLIRVTPNLPTLTKDLRERVHDCPTVSVPYLSHGRASIRGAPALERPVRIAIAVNTEQKDHHSAARFGYIAWRKALNAACEQRGRLRPFGQGRPAGHRREPRTCLRYELQRRHPLWSASVSNAEGAVRLYSRAVFCLQPPGDSLPRAGILDAVAVGCIPVFFDPRQARVRRSNPRPPAAAADS